MLREPCVVYEAGAIFRGYAPRPSLRAAVELIWLVDGIAALGQERVLPNGAIELIINFGAPHRVLHQPGRYTRYQRAWVAGIQRGPLDIANELDTHLLGVRFRPGGAAPVLRLPAYELTDRVIEWEGRLGAWVAESRDRLSEARDDSERLAIMESALEQRLAGGPTPDGRVRAALETLGRAPAGMGLRALSSALGITHKHLIDLFRREVGLTPKVLQRILRFQSVLRAVEHGKVARWTDLAHELGYADQAHLNRDFRIFTGGSPGSYLARRTVDPNHLER